MRIPSDGSSSWSSEAGGRTSLSPGLSPSGRGAFASPMSTVANAPSLAATQTAHWQQPQSRVSPTNDSSADQSRRPKQAEEWPTGVEAVPETTRSVDVSFDLLSQTAPCAQAASRSGPPGAKVPAAEQGPFGEHPRSQERTLSCGQENVSLLLLPSRDGADEEGIGQEETVTLSEADATKRRKPQPLQSAKFEQPQEAQDPRQPLPPQQEGLKHNSANIPEEANPEANVPQRSDLTLGLQVAIVGARGLRHLNHFTGDAPYCVCEVVAGSAGAAVGAHGMSGGEFTRCQTKPARGNLDPIWREVHELQHWREGDGLLFTVYDQGLFGSRAEGHTELRSEDMVDGVFDGVLPLGGTSSGAMLKVATRRPVARSAEVNTPHSRRSWKPEEMGAAAMGANEAPMPQLAQPLPEGCVTQHDEACSGEWVVVTPPEREAAESANLGSVDGAPLVNDEGLAPGALTTPTLAPLEEALASAPVESEQELPKVLALEEPMHEDEPHKLRVEIIRAESLHSLNHFVGDRPYCICEVKNGCRRSRRARCQTQPLGGSLNPMWNEVHELEPWYVGDRLEFAVYDKGLMGSRIMGKAELATEHIQRGFAGELSLDAALGSVLHVMVQIIGPSKVPQSAGSTPKATSLPTDLIDAPMPGTSDSTPPWVPWPRFFDEQGHKPPPPRGSLAVPVGTRPCPCGEPCEPTGRRRAVLVGVSYTGTAVHLGGSVHDIVAMRKVLERLDFDPEWILCLTEDQSDVLYRPTYQNILTAMRWLVEGVVPGDVLFFHFSGHGAQLQDVDATEENMVDDAVCPVDLQQAGPITDNQMFELLVRDLPSGVRLTILVDCCIPGPTANLPFVCDPRRGWLHELDACHSQGDVISLSAFYAGEFPTNSLEVLCGRPGGALSMAFVGALVELARRSAGPVTYMDLLTQMREQFKHFGLAWQPQLSTTQKFNPCVRTFRVSDATPNQNSEFGLRTRKRHRQLRRWYADEGSSHALVLGRWALKQL